MAVELRDGMESQSGKVCIIGRPRDTEAYSATELEAMNLVGIYMKPTQVSRRKKMNDEQFIKMLDEIMGKIDNCPGSHAEALKKIAKRHEITKELREVIGGLNESLETIGLMIKYLVFDLEATRRERDKFRMELEDMD